VTAAPTAFAEEPVGVAGGVPGFGGVGEPVLGGVNIIWHCGHFRGAAVGFGVGGIGIGSAGGAVVERV
jgi:hypothetical protein